MNHKKTASACATRPNVFPSVETEGGDVHSLGIDMLTAKTYCITSTLNMFV